MSEVEIGVIAIGLVVSLLYSEAFGVAPGGIIVPGYLALSIFDPVQIGLTLGVALLTFFAVRVWSTIAIVYGRRRTVLSILTGFAIASLVRSALGVGTPVGPFEVDVIGYVIPGLLAIWMDRQGVVVTLASAITASVFTRLLGLLALGGRVVQRLYWRQAHVSRVVHVLVAVIAAGALFAAERFQQVRVEPDFEIKRAAAQRMERGMELLRNHRVRHVAPVDTALDPTGSGMIGVASSSTTTNAGSLAAKRTTANPNWAAAMIDLLRRAGVERGDAVAIGVSGSFPALNLAAYVAVEELGLEAVAISSAGASSFGANLPGLTWLDMERLLAAAEITRTRSVAASLGGTRDQALGMQDRGRRQLRTAIDRNGVSFIDVDTEQTSIDQRMELYDARAEGRRFAAYINVGGSLVSIGPKSVKRLYRAGVNLRPHPRGTHIDSVMMRFLNDTVPVINLSKVVPLAESYGLPVEPETAPKVGEGAVFEKRTHDRRLVGALVVGVLAASFALLRLDWGARLVELGGGGGSKLERMV